MDRGKVYIAARYSRRDEMRAAARLLYDAGIATTSQWLYENCALDHHLDEFPDDSNRKTAQVDLDDIRKADTLLFFAEDPRVGVPRGGRHFECGYAFAIGKRVVVIGGPENVFLYMPTVIHFSSLEDFIESESRA